MPALAPIASALFAALSLAGCAFAPPPNPAPTAQPIATGTLTPAAFAGRWKTDFSTFRRSGATPMVIQLQNGFYSCTCRAPGRIRTDGNDHPVKWKNGIDSVAIETVDDHSVRETGKIGGKLIFTSRFSVQSNGDAAVMAFTEYGNHPQSFKVGFARVGRGEAGLNAVNGTWQATGMWDASRSVGLYSYTLSGNLIGYHDTQGIFYVAKINGERGPVLRDAKPDGSVEVTSLGETTLRETWYDATGRRKHTCTMTVMPGGQTMHTIDVDYTGGGTLTFTSGKR